MKKNLRFIIIALSILFQIPILMIILFSVMPETQLSNKLIQVIPTPFTLEQYIDIAVNKSVFFKYYGNSLGIALCVILGQLLLSTSAAYYLSKKSNTTNKYILLLYLLVFLMPLQVLIVPNLLSFQWIEQITGINILNTRWVIILPNIFSAVGVLFMKFFIDKIPNEILEAGKVDGASEFKIFTHIVIPNSKNAMLLLSIYIFIDIWSLIEPISLYIDDYKKYPLSALLSSMSGKESYFAASFLYMIPILVSFEVAIKRFEKTINGDT